MSSFSISSEPNDEKLFSLFEEHTELLKRGKAGKPIEFGHKVLFCQTGEKFIHHYKVMPKRIEDKELLEPAIEAHKELFGHYPDLLSTDKGFYESMQQISSLEEKVSVVSIAKQAKDYCIIVCDRLGRYAYERQNLWTNDLSQNRNMDYIFSYIYEKEEREQLRESIQHLQLRLMSRQEAEAIAAKASECAGIEIKPLVFFDRSVFTGRHMDTAEYNLRAQPIRSAVNSLHEGNMRTDLSTLLIDYVPKAGFDFINNYIEHLQVCWNTLVRYVKNLITIYDEEQCCFAEELPEIPASFPTPLREMTERMKRVIEGVWWLGLGLPRENIIEPQLGYALRYLIMKLQHGQGCAHSLAGIFEVDKSYLRNMN